MLLIMVCVFFGALAFNYKKALNEVSEENKSLQMEIAGYKQDLENLQVINRNMNEKLFI